MTAAHHATARVSKPARPVAPNAGEFYIELGTLENTLLDNLAISTVGADGLAIALDASELNSTTQGDLIGDFSATNDGAAEDATFAFVAGDGDTDNGKFQLNGDSLEVGAHDFAADGAGTQYSIRVMGTGEVSANTAESVFILTLELDSDNDGLPDTWELAFTDDDLDILDGRNDADADNDGITDADEFAMNPDADPTGLDPTNADSDNDDLDDGDELIAETDPTDPDTDDDEVLDGLEGEVNGDPLNKDTDGDGWRDGLEVTQDTLVNDAASVPTFPAGVTISAPIIGDCSSGVSDLVTYTHKVSGGDAATINAIDFDALSDLVSPVNLAWAASGGLNVVINNNGEWMPAMGGVIGSGMTSLLESFTYSGAGGEPGSTQSFTLSGLTPGTTYDLRIYVRLWSNLTTRPIDLALVNGAETIAITPEGGAPEDRPSQVLMNDGGENQAYFVNIQYTAEGSEVILQANVPTTAGPASGSFHMYAMTNQVALPAEPFQLVITSITRDIGVPAAPVTITFESQPGATYLVDFSTAMNATGQPSGWLNLEDDLTATEAITSYTDPLAAPGGAPRVFYRVRPK